MTFWQNSIRELMEMQPLTTAYPYRTATIAVLLGATLVASARWFGWSYRLVLSQLNPYVPQRIASPVAFALVALLLMFLSNDLIVKKSTDHFG